MKTLRGIALAGAAMLVLVACGGGADESAATPEPTVAPTLGAVQSVDDVQAAYQEAGGDCAGELESRNNVITATSSGVCPGSGTVLTAYIDREDAKEGVEGLLGLTDLVGFAVIIGDNWVVNPSGGDQDKIDEIAEHMGGQVISKAAVEEAVPTKASGIEVSGDFAADLERHVGLTDEDVEGVDSFREYLREDLCETDLDPERKGPAAFKVMVERYGNPDATFGIDPDVVRLVIAYDCEDRMELAEEYLAGIGA